MKTVFSLIFTMSFMPSLFCGSNENSHVWSVVSSILDDVRRESSARIDSKIIGKIKNVEHISRASANRFESGAIKDVKKIKKICSEKIEKIRLNSDENIQQAIIEAKQGIDFIRRSYDSNIEKININVAEEIMQLLKEVEEDVFRFDCAKKEKTIFSKVQDAFEDITRRDINFDWLSGNVFQISVPTYWKRHIADNFYRNSDDLEQIVLSAESCSQIDEFVKCFNNQRAWFDRTLSTTKYTSDPGYSQIINKKILIDNMVAAVKKVDTNLVHWENLLHLSNKELNKIKLIFLYELNSEMQGLKGLPVVPKPLTDENIRLLTLKITQDVTGRAVKAFPEIDFNNLKISVIPKDMQVISKINQVVSDLKYEVANKDFNIGVVDEYLDKLSSDLFNLSMQVMNDGRVKKFLMDKVKKLTKKCNDSATQIKKISMQLSTRNAELKKMEDESEKASQNLNRLKIENVEIKNKIEFIQDMTNRQIEEQSEILRNKYANVGNNQSSYSEVVRKQEVLNKKKLEDELAQRTMFK